MLSEENRSLVQQNAALLLEIKHKPFSTIPFIILNSVLLLINSAQEISFWLISHK